MYSRTIVTPGERYFMILSLHVYFQKKKKKAKAKAHKTTSTNLVSSGHRTCGSVDIQLRSNGVAVSDSIIASLCSLLHSIEGLLWATTIFTTSFPNFEGRDLYLMISSVVSKMT